MNYEDLIGPEQAKLKLLRDKYALLGNEIAESEEFIRLLLKRAGRGSDELDRALERQLASASASSAECLLETEKHPILEPVLETQVNHSKYPSLRKDSIWPYLAKLMSGKASWTLDELNDIAIRHNLIKTESALRSTMPSMKKWALVTSDRPGVFALTPKGVGFTRALGSSQYTLTTQENANGGASGS